MKTKHTQGKWEVDIQSKFQKAIVCNNAAICFIPNQSEKANANAKLIAAAPDLLAVLLMIKPVFDGKNNGYERAINGAIKKATE